MHMLSPSLWRAPALAAALLVALAVSGCAFKNPFASTNPLIDDEPAPKTVAQAEAAPAGKEAATAKSDTASVKSEAEPAKPVLPKPVLVVKPAEESRPADAAPSLEQKKDAAKPVAPATESKPAAPAASASLGPEAEPKPAIAKISDPGRSAPTGWNRWLGIFKPYKINIQQGNFVSQDMATKVRIGMTKEQVRFVLGTPLLTDMFHANRWDYLFRLQKPNGELTANRIAIFFRDNRVERIESSELPSESEYLTHIAGPAEPAKPAAAAPAAKPASSTPEPATKP